MINDDFEMILRRKNKLDFKIKSKFLNDSKLLRTHTLSRLKDYLSSFRLDKR